VRPIGLVLIYGLKWSALGLRAAAAGLLS